jgi:2-methylcitrate dehydratase PrpD
MSTISQELASFAHDLDFKAIPKEVVEKIKLHLLDTLGIGLVSSKMDFAEVVYKTAAELGDGQDSTVVGLGKKLPMVSAALVNGTLAHGIDFDDTHIGAILHVSATIAAAGLTVGEAKGASGTQLIEALAVGMETSTRLGLAAEGGFNVRGMHQTGMCTPFGACLTTGKLLNLPKGALENSLGVCGTMASGILQIESSWLKRINPGWAAHSGIISASLGHHGFIGPREVFEGVHGFYKSHLGDERKFNWGLIRDDLGKKWETLNIAIKPYPACHYAHAFVDCAKFLRENHGIKAEDIEHIECKASKQIVSLVFEPKDRKVCPTNPYEAQFSTQYLVAAMLGKGYVNLDTVYFEPLDDPGILSLADKIAWVPDPESDFPANLPGEVRIVLKDGREFSKRERFNRGGPRNPMSKDEIVDKFMDNACRAIPSNQAQEIARLIDNLEECGDVGQLVNLCTRAT